MKRDLAREERAALYEILKSGGTLNFFVNFEDGSSVLVYVSVFGIGENTIKKWCEKVTGGNVIEVYHVPQEDLQYYCIDERVWVDTKEKAEKILKQIA